MIAIYRHFGHPPQLLTLDQVRDYLLYLINVRQMFVELVETSGGSPALVLWQHPWPHRHGPLHPVSEARSSPARRAQPVGGGTVDQRCSIPEAPHRVDDDLWNRPSRFGSMQA